MQNYLAGKLADFRVRAIESAKKENEVAALALQDRLRKESEEHNRLKKFRETCESHLSRIQVMLVDILSAPSEVLTFIQDLMKNLEEVPCLNGGFYEKEGYVLLEIMKLPDVPYPGGWKRDYGFALMLPPDLSSARLILYSFGYEVGTILITREEYTLPFAKEVLEALETMATPEGFCEVLFMRYRHYLLKKEQEADLSA